MAANLRTSIVLAVIAASLLAFIVWFERGTPSSSELEQRKDNALPGFIRDQVRKLEIQRGGAVTMLVRQDAEEPSEQLWRVEAPYRAKADRESVDSLLSELEFMPARRRLQGISAQDRANFGFDHPRFRVWYTLGESRKRLLVGHESPRGDGVYVQGEDAAAAFIVDKRLVETLSQDSGGYHSKELLSEVRAAQLASLRVRDEHGERVLSHAAEQWSLTTPPLGLASSSAVTDLVLALEALRAKRFIAQAPSAAQLASFGLDAPRIAIALQYRAAADGAKLAEGKTQPPASLTVGHACAQHAGESYVTTGADAAVMCVADAELSKLRPTAAQLREPRLLPFDADESLTSVQLERGDSRLLLRKADTGWSYETSRAGQTMLKGSARADAVSAWLDALRNMQASRWQPGPLSGAITDRIALRVEREAGKPPFELQLDASQSEPRAYRSGEPELAVFPASALELLAVSAARFRPLDVAHIAEAAVREIAVRRGTQLERISRESEGAYFAILAPVRAPVDSSRFAELMRWLGALEVVRFVADSPSSVHGLGSAQSQLSVEYDASGKDAPRQKLGLRVGAATEGGHFAQLEGQPGVFVIAPQLAELLSEPLISRTALSVPLDALQSVEFMRDRRDVHLTRKGQEFVADDAALDAPAVRTLVERLATLRASSVLNYGPATAAEGFEKPFARMLLTRGGTTAGERVELLFGAQTPAGRHVRRSDLGLSFVVSATSADSILGVLNAGAASKH